MLVLIFVAIRMLANIEATFKRHLGRHAPEGRNWLLRTVLYWTTITLGPMLLIAALALAGGSHLQTAKNFIHHTPFIGSLIFHLVPFGGLWLTFALLYQLVPNTKVKFSAALVGGIVGGSLWHLNNIFGFLYVSRVVTYSKIYGSLGLVPVFMAGLYLSWAILLFGAQVAYAFQNRKSFLQDKLVENVNQRGREFIALRLMTCICQRFQRAAKPVTIQEISAELGIPTKLAQQVLRALIATRLVVENRPEPSLPIRPRARLTPSARTMFCSRSAWASGRNCSCATSRCAREFTANLRASRKPNAKPPHPSRCSRSSIAPKRGSKFARPPHPKMKKEFLCRPGKKLKTNRNEPKKILWTGPRNRQSLTGLFWSCGLPCGFNCKTCSSPFCASSNRFASSGVICPGASGWPSPF